ncbi:hypothetical protein C2G38_2162585 [Gigaspora rosea]|uniref:Uncharacterized protein n=1 Tax=Gigaspora rosea TaxID=44941 RepID=A0A397W5Z0_9GLOM|nr:hypothetical protein C2G38_2162585 [Gigaspora rosea]
MTPDPLVDGERANFNVSGTLINDIHARITDLRIRFFSDPTEQTSARHDNFNKSYLFTPTSSNATS